jgi:hypothetical protein
MAFTNVFLNSYKQPENKLTYNFLCLLEHMPSRSEFCEFLTDNRIKLASDPIETIETIYSGRSSNPDGSLVLMDRNGQRWTVFLENKTRRRQLDTCQLQNHLASYCNNSNELLLVITPRASDRPAAESVSRKIVFKTWAEIISKLVEINRNLDEPSFIIKQFIDHGQQTGEFMSMEIKKGDIEAYVHTIKYNVRGKMVGLFHATSTNFDFGKLGITNLSLEDEDRWGRQGSVFFFKPEKQYGQWFFCGIYHNESDHGISFKQLGVPELAFFLDIVPKHREKLKAVRGLETEIVDLQRQGFDDNLFSKITSNNWRFLAKRQPLTNVDQLTEAVISDFLNKTLQMLKQKPIIWHEMFLK